MCGKNFAARMWPTEREQAGLRALGKLTALPILGCGALSIVSGATGHNFSTRLFTGGALHFNDAVTGAVLLAIGLLLLRVSGGAPLWQQVRATRHWGRRHWISVGLFAIAAIAATAQGVVEPLLGLSRWVHYVLSGAIALVMTGGVLLWPRKRDRPAQS
jgi:hypothetical protein